MVITLSYIILSFIPFHLVREHFSAPLLQFAIDDGERTFTLVECPSERSDDNELFT